MRKLILAAIAVGTLSTGMASWANARDFHNGSTIAGDARATQMQQSGSLAE